MKAYLHEYPFGLKQNRVDLMSKVCILPWMMRDLTHKMCSYIQNRLAFLNALESCNLCTMPTKGCSYAYVLEHCNWCYQFSWL